jgi:hypothetical protein
MEIMLIVLLNFCCLWSCDVHGDWMRKNNCSSLQFGLAMTQPTRGVPIFGKKTMLTWGFKARFLKLKNTYNILLLKLKFILKN